MQITFHFIKFCNFWLNTVNENDVTTLQYEHKDLHNYSQYRLLKMIQKINDIQIEA